jgi:hypothetical protein
LSQGTKNTKVQSSSPLMSQNRLPFQLRVFKSDRVNPNKKSNKIIVNYINLTRKNEANQTRKDLRRIRPAPPFTATTTRINRPSKIFFSVGAVCRAVAVTNCKPQVTCPDNSAIQPTVTNPHDHQPITQRTAICWWHKHESFTSTSITT